jgi:hypothetical protein
MQRVALRTAKDLEATRSQLGLLTITGRVCTSVPRYACDLKYLAMELTLYFTAVNAM